MILYLLYYNLFLINTIYVTVPYKRRMENEKKIRLLRADEIECRVGTVSEKGISLLLYKDARVDQAILDETFGIMGWQRKHELIGNDLFCTVKVRDEHGEWIEKQDVGTPSMAEPVKGAASDSFKRACFNIGVGRELYSSPFLWISAEKVNLVNEKGKWVVKDKFRVSSISYDESDSIIALEICNGRNEVVYTYGNVYNVQKTVQVQEEKGIGKTKEQKLRKELERTGVSEDVLCARYGIKQIQEMDEETYKRAMNALKKTKDVAA